MRLLPCHSGHRFRLPHWQLYQYVDIKLVGRATVVALEESGKELIFNRDDMELDWIHLGATPVSRRKRDRF